MKKLAVIFLAAVLAASAVLPAFSATNPFMDVPMNHWAYDAIGQLAAHGILSGFPDGTYKGQQQTTRYEMASALARSLAVVDMTKASKQDVEMLKRLVVEFKDELEALGVRVDELDERVAVLEDRLGGWRIHGSLVFDVMNESRKSASDSFGADGKGSAKFDEARLFFERNFGENDDYFFQARIRDEGGLKGEDSDIRFDRFFVEMPFFFDTKMTVGRFNWALEGDYKISLPGTGVWDGDQILTDWTFEGFGLSKNFGLGMARIVAAHPSDRWTANGQTLDTWMIIPQATLQFTEQFGFDIGGQVLLGDNAETYPVVQDSNGNLSLGDKHGEGDFSFNSLWTVYGGLRFNFNDAVSLKGTFYHQKAKFEEVINDNGTLRWVDYGFFGSQYNADDTANHWSAIIDVKQSALKYTSLWLEYGQFQEGFWTNNKGAAYYGGLLQDSIASGGFMRGNQMYNDVKYWRIGLGQEWNDQWSTYLFYYGYDVDVQGLGAANGTRKPKEFGLGVQYKLNDYTTLGLNYMHADNDGGVLGNNDKEDNVVRFRTKVTF